VNQNSAKLMEKIIYMLSQIFLYFCSNLAYSGFNIYPQFKHQRTTSCTLTHRDAANGSSPGDNRAYRRSRHHHRVVEAERRARRLWSLLRAEMRGAASRWGEKQARGGVWRRRGGATREQCRRWEGKLYRSISCFLHDAGAKQEDDGSFSDNVSFFFY
jgi:hypothetical protein